MGTYRHTHTGIHWLSWLRHRSQLGKWAFSYCFHYYCTIPLFLLSFPFSSVIFRMLFTVQPFITCLETFCVSGWCINDHTLTHPPTVGINCVFATEGFFFCIITLLYVLLFGWVILKPPFRSFMSSSWLLCVEFDQFAPCQGTSITLPYHRAVLSERNINWLQAMITDLLTIMLHNQKQHLRKPCNLKNSF